MRSLRGSLLLAGFLGAALIAPLAAVAIEPSANSSQRIQDLVAEARELLQTIRVQIRDVDIAMQRAIAQTGDTSRMFSNSYEYRELKRSASNLSDVGNRVFTLASRCGADGKKIGQNFKSSVRRLSSDLNRMASSSTTTLARMTIDDLNRDVESITRDLQAVASVPDCSPESDEEPEGEVASKSE
jgi:hypothetical protein